MFSKKEKSFHEDMRREGDFKVGSDRNFGIVFAVAFGLIAAFSWLRGGQNWILWSIGSSIFVSLAILYPRSLTPLNRVWMKLGIVLFHITNPIMLAFLYYACITPIGIAMRLMGKDLLNLKSDPASKTYWILRKPPGPDPESLKNQY